MTKNFNINTNNNDEWLTPPELVRALGPFDLDPCSPVDRPWETAGYHYTINDAGLDSFWYGRVWLNPPYGQHTFQWLEKLSEHGSGIALIFSRTETIGFHQQVWDKANSVFFFKGQLCFYERYWYVAHQWKNLSQLVKYWADEKLSEKEFHDRVNNSDMKWDNPSPAGAPSVLVSYSENDSGVIDTALADGSIKGRHVIL